MYGWVSVMWCDVMLPIQKYILQVTEYSRVRRVGVEIFEGVLTNCIYGAKNSMN